MPSLPDVPDGAKQGIDALICRIICDRDGLQQLILFSTQSACLPSEKLSRLVVGGWDDARMTLRVLAL